MADTTNLPEINLPVNIVEIMNLIPHRYPFLLIDRVIDVVRSKEITVIKNVTFNENFFVGHFTKYPVMPGVLIVEAMAQSAGVLYHLSNGLSDGNSIPFFASIDKVKFKKQVIPGDTIIFKIEVLVDKKKLMKSRGVAYVDGIVAAEAELLLIKKEI